VIDLQHQYPNDDEDFAGLYGYNLTFNKCGFLGASNKYFVL